MTAPSPTTDDPAEIGVTFLHDLYIGSDSSARTEPFPHPLRLHAALLASAGTGSLSVPDTGVTVPAKTVRSSPTTTLVPRAVAPQARAALEWLENHPPDTIVLPLLYDSPPRIGSEHITYAHRGQMKKLVISKTETRVCDGQALAGELVYHWAQMPGDVAAVLAVLTAELGYLGMSRSVVSAELRTGDGCTAGRAPADRTLYRETDPALAYGPTDGEHLRIQAAASGRTRELIDSFAAEVRALADANPSKPAVDLRADQHDTRGPGTPARLASRQHRRSVNYRRAGQELTAPWRRVTALGLTLPIHPDQHVELAVRVHRSLVSIIGTGCPTSISGSYPDGAPKAANHLSIQVLPAEFAPRALREHLPDAPAFLLLAEPDGMSVDDAELLTGALTVLRNRTLYPGHRPICPDLPTVGITGPPLTIDAETFWDSDDLAEPARRQTYPAAVNEITDSLDNIVSIGLAGTFRQRLVDADGAPPRGLRAMLSRWAQATAGHGIRVHRGSRILTDVGTYLHKVPDNPRLVIAPYRVGVDLGALTAPRAFLAVGQTRHLGGGLLIPAEKLPAPLRLIGPADEITEEIA